MEKIKKLVSLIMIVLVLFMTIPCYSVYAESNKVIETDVNEAKDGCIMLGIEGSYFVSIDKAVERLNEIRYEACKEGVLNPGTGRALTLKDYVEIKWSSDLEYIARIRAAESSLTMDHVRTNNEWCFAIESPNGVSSYGEVLAWNWSENMLMAIEQWYAEKADWVAQNKEAVTGHYTIMIDPDNNYFGLGTFCTENGNYYNTTAGEFCSSRFRLDETHGTEIKNCIQKLEVSASALHGNPSIKGKEKLKSGEAATLHAVTDVRFSEGSGKDLYILNSSWKTSDESVISVEATINSTCLINANKCGTSTVTTSFNGKNISKTVIVEHSYTNLISKQPTYFSKGYTCKSCSACSSVTDKKEIPMLVMSAPKAKVGANYIKLSWQKVPEAEGYEVWQRLSGKWKKINTTKSTSYTVSKLPAGTSQKFAIKPIKSSGSKTVSGALSKQLSSTTNPASVNFKLSSSQKKVTVKWNKVTGASGYRVYFKTSENGSWKLMKKVNNKTTTLTKTGLSKGKTYYFSVKAYKILNGKTYNGAYYSKSIRVK